MASILFGLLVLIFGVHLFGIVGSWYWHYLWLDTFMHLVGGAWVALVFVYVAGELLKVFDVRRSVLITLVGALSVVALVGILWEFYEYVNDTYILHTPLDAPRPHPNLYKDTLKDFLSDLGGGFIAIVAWWFAVKYFVNPVRNHRPRASAPEGPVRRDISNGVNPAARRKIS